MITLVKRLFFYKKLKLIKKKHFNSVFQKAHKINSEHIIILTKKNTLSHPRLGLIIAKKYVKQSCKRNYIKRLIREYFRVHQHTLSHMDFIILIRKNINFINKHYLIKELHDIWH